MVMRTSVFALLLVLLSALPLSSGQAAGEWYGDKERGWFWKEQPPEPPKPPEPKEEKTVQVVVPAATVVEQKKTAKEEMEEHKAMMEEAKAEAILRPTPASLANYMTLQEQTMNQAMMFTDMWQRVRWSNPMLDYSFVHPTATGGVRVDRAMTREQEKELVKAVAKDAGIFFFFKANCPYCEEQGRILDSLVQTYGIKIMAVSLDGASNQYFPDAKPDNGIAAKMGVQDAPAMFIVNPDTKETLPLGYGIVPIDEIESRIRRLVAMQPGVY